jgi:hypothetical protein
MLKTRGPKRLQKPKHRVAAEEKKLLNAVYKRLYAEIDRVYEAMSEEAAEMRTQ